MPDIAWNREKWTQFGWKRKGDEWSADYGSADTQWYTSIFPRLRHVLPVKNILEIAPGHGRWTDFLIRHCDHLVGYDLNEVCTVGCTSRFKDQVEHGVCQFYTNDGLTLPNTPDNSIDLVFSYDSLVHVESDVVASYIKETFRVLRPDGYAFLHHSNLADKRDDFKDGTLGRGLSVGATFVANTALQTGLTPVVQEKISWQSQGLRDCITLLVKKPGPIEAKTIENPQFWDFAHLARSTVGTWEDAVGNVSLVSETPKG